VPSRPLASGGATPPGSQVTVLRVALGRSPVTGKKPDQGRCRRRATSAFRSTRHDAPVGEIARLSEGPGAMPRKPAGRILRIQPGSGRGSIAKERASSAYMLSVGGRGCTVRAGAARRVQGSCSAVDAAALRVRPARTLQLPRSARSLLPGPAGSGSRWPVGLAIAVLRAVA